MSEMMGHSLSLAAAVVAWMVLTAFDAAPVEEVDVVVVVVEDEADDDDDDVDDDDDDVDEEWVRSV